MNLINMADSRHRTKSRIPNGDILCRAVAASHQTLFKSIHFQDLKREIRKRIILSFFNFFIGTLVVIMGLGWIFILGSLGLFETVLLLLCGVGILAVLVAVSKKYQNFLFDRELNHVLFNNIISALEINHSREHLFSATGIDVQKHITQSNLLHLNNFTITRCKNTIRNRDGFPLFQITQLEIYHIVHKKKVFTGYFLAAQLPQTIDGSVAISNKETTYKSGFISFLKLFFLRKTKRHLKLEWNDFNRAFDVITDSPQVAKQVLTPDVMADLYDWVLEKNKPIKLSIKKDMLYGILFDKKISMKHSFSFSELRGLLQYTQNAALPIWFLQVLADDIFGR